MSDSKEVLVDPELKEMIVRALENAGALQSIRAQLRAATYLALEGQQDFPVSKSRIRSISQTENGILAIQLIRDFLLNADLPHTLAVFDAESGSGSNSDQEIDRISASYTLDLPENSDRPLLLQLVEDSRNSTKELQRPKTAGRKSQSLLPSSAGEEFAGDGEERFTRDDEERFAGDGEERFVGDSEKRSAGDGDGDEKFIGDGDFFDS